MAKTDPNKKSNRQKMLEARRAATRGPKAPVITVKQARVLFKKDPDAFVRQYGRSLTDILKSTGGMPTKATMDAHALKSWKTLAMIYYDNYKFRIDEKYRDEIPAKIQEQKEPINWGREEWIAYNGDKSYSDIQRFLAVFAIILGISYEELTGEALKPEEGIDEDVEGLY